MALANAAAVEISRLFQDPEYSDRIAVFHDGGHANRCQLLQESTAGQLVAADCPDSGECGDETLIDY